MRNVRAVSLRFLCLIILVGALAFPCSRSFFKVPYHKNGRSTTPLFRFERNGKAGYINATGKVVIPPKFDVGWFAEEDFVEGLSPARLGENWGFIDTAGNWVVQPKYWRVEPFSEGLAAVTFQLQGYEFPAAYIDKTGAVAFQFPKGVASTAPFSEGLAAVRQHGSVSIGKLGYVDRSGTAVIPYEYALGGQFHEGLAPVVFDGQCYIEARDDSGRSPSPSVPAATSCGGVPSFVTQRCGEGFIDKNGRVVLRFEGAREFSEGLAAVEEKGNWGFIRPDGRFRIEPQFAAARSFSDGLAAAEVDRKWGYVDASGKWIIQPQFNAAADFSDGLALTDAGYVDRTGATIASAKEGTAFVQGLAHVALAKGEYGYMNHLGKVVFRYRPDVVKPSMLPYSGR